MKLPIFNGNGLEEPEKHWFLCESIWTVRQVQDSIVKSAHMIMTFRVHSLDWYMMFYVLLGGTRQNSLDQIHNGFIDEFKNPKSKLQCIIELKEIKQFSSEYVWYFDRRFKTMMDKVRFYISMFSINNCLLLCYYLIFMFP